MRSAAAAVAVLVAGLATALSARAEVTSLSAHGFTSMHVHVLEAPPAADGRTTFTSKYVVSGYLEGGFAALAPAVDGVNGGHFARLERVAAGRPPTE